MFHIEKLNKNIIFNPIDKTVYQKISHKCWDLDEKVKILLTKQNAIGISIFVDETSIGSIHFYSLDEDVDNTLFPDYGMDDPHHFPLGLPALALKEKLIKPARKTLGIACYHVGLLADSTDDSIYYGKGIGTHLLKETIKWAKSNNYSQIIAHGCPMSLYEYNIGFGGLPWTTYKKLGFKSIFDSQDSKKLPVWFTTLPQGYKDRIELILSIGGTYEDILNSVMVYDVT